MQKPYRENLINQIEFVNEFLILSLSCLLWAFSDFQAEGRVRYDIGWVYFSLLAVTFIGNILVYLKVNIYNYCTKKFIKRAKIKSF